MSEMTITTTVQLRAWLSEHRYFEESYCLSARPTAEEYPPEYAEHLDRPEAVVVELAEQVGGGWTAGDVRVMSVFACTGTDVREWTPGSPTGPYLHNGVKVVEGNTGLGLDLGPHGRLVCGRLVVERRPDRSIPVEPHADPYHVSVRVPAGTPPTPQDWLDWFAGAGEDVAWRVYGGGEWPAERMAADGGGGSYAAFVQRRRDIAETRSGVFIDVRRSDGPGFDVLLADGTGRTPETPGQDALWRAAAGILARFPGAEVRSGNCPFTVGQWDRYVREGVLPDFQNRTDATTVNPQP